MEVTKVSNGFLIHLTLEEAAELTAFALHQGQEAQTWVPSAGLERVLALARALL